MENLTETLKSKMYHFSVQAMIWASWMWELTRDFSLKTWEGAVDAHRPSNWVFFHRNALPWIVKGSLPADFVPEMLYFPETNEFKSSVENYHHHSFDSVMGATLVKGRTRVDLSWFFVGVRWSGLSNPSLYEMVLTALLSQGMFKEIQHLRKYSLVVEFVDRDNLSMSMNRKQNPSILEPFSKFPEPAPEPTPAPEPAPEPAVVSDCYNTGIMNDDKPGVPSAGIEAANKEKLDEHVTTWVELQREVSGNE